MIIKHHITPKKPSLGMWLLNSPKVIPIIAKTSTYTIVAIGIGLLVYSRLILGLKVVTGLTVLGVVMIALGMLADLKLHETLKVVEGMRIIDFVPGKDKEDDENETTD